MFLSLSAFHMFSTGTQILYAQSVITILCQDGSTFSVSYNSHIYALCFFHCGVCGCQTKVKQKA